MKRDSGTDKLPFHFKKCSWFSSVDINKYFSSWGSCPSLPWKPSGKKPLNQVGFILKPGNKQPLSYVFLLQKAQSCDVCEEFTRYEYNDMIYIHNFYKLEACQKNCKSKFLLFIASSVLSFIFQTFFFTFLKVCNLLSYHCVSPIKFLLYFALL